MRTVLGGVALVASLFVWSQPAKATALELLGQCETLIAGAQVNGDSVRNCTQIKSLKNQYLRFAGADGRRPRY